MPTSVYRIGVPVDFSGRDAIRFTLESLGADPTGGDLWTGRAWFRAGAIRYYDGSGVQTLGVAGGGLTQEQVADLVDAMTNGAHTGVTVTYDDAAESGAGTLTLAVTDSPLLAGQNGGYYLNRVNHTGTQSADTLVDGTTNHVFTAADDTKLGGVAAGATVNATDAQLRDRSTHTGTQTAATISDFSTAVDARVANVVDAAPAALDTLNELAAALGDDPNFATTITTALGTKVTKGGAVTQASGASTAATTVTHNLGTYDVTVAAFYDDGDREDFGVIVERPTVNSVIVRYGADLTRPVRVLLASHA